jgi:hypothetical protein
MTMKEHKIIAMWSGPRNISTAMMYAFGNRSDCEAWDEPFYGFALKAGGHDHPMRQEIIGGMETDWNRLVENCTATSEKPLLYQKQMTHHMLEGYDRGFITMLSNAFLIRDPARVLASYAQKWADVDLRAIGFIQQSEIFDLVAQHLGRAPPVIDADDILEEPRTMLTRLCAALGIAFDEAMLSWPKGPKHFDGIWAPHWYNAAWKSEGFTQQRRAPLPELPAQLASIADAARPYYDKLRQHALQP